MIFKLLFKSEGTSIFNQPTTYHNVLGRFDINTIREMEDLGNAAVNATGYPITDFNIAPENEHWQQDIEPGFNKYITDVTQ